MAIALLIDGSELKCSKGFEIFYQKIIWVANELELTVLGEQVAIVYRLR